uniref:Uncharacterized protein n=1 Tax=Panagrolaimus davidi TaxID=227884 RepID=A0A914QAZ3_9BILA
MSAVKQHATSLLTFSKKVKAEPLHLFSSTTAFDDQAKNMLIITEMKEKNQILFGDEPECIIADDEDEEDCTLVEPFDNNDIENWD